MKVVIDTNVLLSALLFKGIAARIHTLWRTVQIVPYANREMMLEYARVLTYKKFQLSSDEIAALIEEELLPFFKIVPAAERVLPFLPDDKHDIPFLDAAVAGDAAMLISGDAHLLALDGKYSFSILPPGLFLERWNG
jgi:putative PIN family toxin of toxin-antitoxin system